MKQINKEGQVVKIIIGVLLSMLTISFTFYNLEDWDYYKERVKEYENYKEPEQTSTHVVSSKAPLDNPYKFNSQCVIGVDYGQDRLVTGALSLYQSTGIQLYDCTFEFGKTMFATETEVQAEVKSKIEEIEGHEYCIIMYSYNTDYDYNETGYYASYDNFYYGDKVAEYLSADDLSMIQHYVQHAYDLFEYDERESAIWTNVGENIKNGYDLAKVLGKEKDYTTESSIDRLKMYIDSMNSAIVCTLFGALASIASVWLLISGITKLRKYNKLHIQQLEAEINLKNAQADKAILEADMEYMKNDVDDLVNKYAGDKEE